MGKKTFNVEFDFFGERERDFYRKFSVESILVQGKHRNPPPLVTIILPTYKRPELLKQALESALNQVDFEDYQIIIADNEGTDIRMETETARLVSCYQDEKILYYRHEKTINYKMDYAARLSRSKWICFLHDDDILASNHLYVMSRIVQKHKDIKYLSCTYKYFFDEICTNDFRKMTEPHRISFQIKKVPKAYTCVGYFAGWLGAFINREAQKTKVDASVADTENGAYPV